MYEIDENEWKSMQSRKNKYIAALLAFVGGVFGVHRFYLNQKGLAFLMIGLSLISLGILSWIISLIDTFFFLTMDSDRFEEKYNQRSNNEEEDFYYKSYERPISDQNQEQSSMGYRKRKRELKKVQEYRKKGVEYFRLYDFEEAIEEFKKAIEIDPYNVAAHFNIACAYSQIEKPKKSMYHISMAVEGGFDNFHKINEHEKLAFIRIQPEWEKFVEKGYRVDDIYDVEEEDLQEEQLKNKEQKEVKELGEEDPNLLERLKKLQEQREKGGISEEDFELQRKKLMSS